jgi:hypothetical protein
MPWRYISEERNIQCSEFLKSHKRPINCVTVLLTDRLTGWLHHSAGSSRSCISFPRSFDFTCASEPRKLSGHNETPLVYLTAIQFTFSQPVPEIHLHFAPLTKPVHPKYIITKIILNVTNTYVSLVLHAQPSLPFLY